MDIHYWKQVISKVFGFILGVLGMLAAVVMLYKEGLSFLAILVLLGSAALMVISYREPIFAKSIPLSKVIADKDATAYHEEWDDDVYILPASEFKAVTSDYLNYFGIYDTLEGLEIPLEILENHLSKYDLIRFSKVYSEAGDNCTLDKDAIAFDGLVIHYSDVKIITSILWNTLYWGDNEKSHEKIRCALRDFTQKYPLIMVNFLPGQIDCLNSQHITNVRTWKYEHEKNNDTPTKPKTN